jgi:FdhD protein
MDIRHLEGLKSMTSGCGRGITYINPGKMESFEELDDSFKVSAKLIWKTMKSFNTRSELYRNIGGVHSALLQCGNLSLFAEDIGRHNCFDKIAGMLLKDRGLSVAGQSVLFTSGRISSEIVTKLVRLKTPILVSRSAPTAAAAELAEEYNVTLLGYVRGDRGIVYTGEERIIL